MRVREIHSPINQICFEVFLCTLLRVVHDPDQDCS